LLGFAAGGTVKPPQAFTPAATVSAVLIMCRQDMRRQRVVAIPAQEESVQIRITARLELVTAAA
jgi:hypothetical protein